MAKANRYPIFYGSCGREVLIISKTSYLKACRIFLDGPLPPAPFDIDAGARSFSSTTLTMLQRKSRLRSIDKHTGATSTFVKGLSFIQHLRESKFDIGMQVNVIERILEI